MLLALARWFQTRADLNAEWTAPLMARGQRVDQAVGQVAMDAADGQSAADDTSAADCSTATARHPGQPPAHWLERLESGGPPAHWLEWIQQRTSDRGGTEATQPLAIEGSGRQGQDELVPEPGSPIAHDMSRTSSPLPVVSRALSVESEPIARDEIEPKAGPFVAPRIDTDGHEPPEADVETSSEDVPSFVQAGHDSASILLSQGERGVRGAVISSQSQGTEQPVAKTPQETSSPGEPRVEKETSVSTARVHSNPSIMAGAERGEAPLRRQPPSPALPEEQAGSPSSPAQPGGQVSVSEPRLNPVEHPWRIPQREAAGLSLGGTLRPPGTDSAERTLSATPEQAVAQSPARDRGAGRPSRGRDAPRTQGALSGRSSEPVASTHWVDLGAGLPMDQSGPLPHATGPDPRAGVMDEMSEYAEGRWPTLPDDERFTYRPTFAEDWERELRAWRRVQRLDREQRGILWNELPF